MGVSIAVLGIARIGIATAVWVMGIIVAVAGHLGGWLAGGVWKCKDLLLVVDCSDCFEASVQLL